MKIYNKMSNMNKNKINKKKVRVKRKNNKQMYSRSKKEKMLKAHLPFHNILYKNN